MSIPNKLRYQILKRDNFRCCLCGRTAIEDGVKLEVDHKISRAKGGSDDTSNLWTLCFACNRGKYSDELPNFIYDKLDIKVLTSPKTAEKRAASPVIPFLPKVGKVSSSGTTNQLAYWRGKQGLTVRALAEMSGVTAAAITRIEMGVARPYLSTLGKLASALDIDITELAALAGVAV